MAKRRLKNNKRAKELLITELINTVNICLDYYTGTCLTLGQSDKLHDLFNEFNLKTIREPDPEFIANLQAELDDE